MFEVGVLKKLTADVFVRYYFVGSKKRRVYGKILHIKPCYFYGIRYNFLIYEFLKKMCCENFNYLNNYLNISI